MNQVLSKGQDMPGDKLCAAFQCISGWLVCGLIALFACGCDSGIPKYEITGKLTLNGDPIPQGRIIFTPKTGAHGYGAQGVARVDDGEIISHDEKRVIGGSYSVRIMGFDGIPYTDGSGATVKYGSPLFMPVHAEVDLPQQDASLDINIESRNGDHKTDVQVVKR